MRWERTRGFVSKNPKNRIDRRVEYITLAVVRLTHKLRSLAKAKTKTPRERQKPPKIKIMVDRHDVRRWKMVNTTLRPTVVTGNTTRNVVHRVILLYYKWCGRIPQCCHQSGKNMIRSEFTNLYNSVLRKVKIMKPRALSL